MTTDSTKSLVAGALASLCTAAAAHDGHGLSGGHWHATDAWGLLAFVAVLAAALWYSRGGRP